MTRFLKLGHAVVSSDVLLVSQQRPRPDGSAWTRCAWVELKIVVEGLLSHWRLRRQSLRKRITQAFCLVLAFEDLATLAIELIHREKRSDTQEDQRLITFPSTRYVDQQHRPNAHPLDSKPEAISSLRPPARSGSYTITCALCALYQVLDESKGGVQKLDLRDAAQ
ncbi:hypothetical protein [Pseudomonas aeruginosa]|uniref:hypothetical protein n=1 Tax=Pseudomonas aeruginosa TaxID=287 RepID=UPI001EB73748|nr:hypothetical protein [Pseudomonas aeruginosa]MBX6882373.1 hypothetical protein [Pseudomonas aeruginosa]MBX6932677.1 hypothetical protein [Pseudomonas aeruginosa]MCZ9867178.1 hypothetical protein [Pseudomonas aeruginosa]MCZ9906420.1 hypothetical protein [Pseudomonas aeruginosa]WHV60962.1 hypothetical protein M2I93_33055 [Pseudomonas aeruginosa]